MMEIKIPTRREWYPCPYCGQHLLVYADTAVCSGLYNGLTIQKKDDYYCLVLTKLPQNQ